MRPRGTISSRSQGSHRIRISLGRDPITGKRRFSTKTVRGSLNEAKRELTRLLSSIDNGEHVDPTRMTVGDWLDTWIAATKAEVSGKTHERYAEIVRCYLMPALGMIPPQKLTAADIQRAYGGFDRNPSPRTRRHIHRILKSALARAVEQQRLSRNPAATIKRLPKVEPKPVATLTVEQSTRLPGAIRHTTTYWPVLIALATGMRRREILALRWKNVDLDSGAVRVVESLEQTKAGLRFKSTKSEKARAVPLPRFAIAELRDWKRKQAEALLRLGVSSPVKMSRFDQAVSAVAATISAAVSASDAARITKATVSAAWMTNRNANLTSAASLGVPAPNSPRIRMPRL